MSSYKNHQNLIKRFKLEYPKTIPNLRIFERHVGLFFTKRGTPIQINKKGMADLYGIVNGIHIELEVKTGNAVLSKHQKVWKKFCENFNIPFFLMRDEHETIKEIKDYLDGLFTN